MTAFVSAPERDALGSASKASLDPLRFCVYTTVAVLAWIVSAPVMMMAMSGLGFWMYSRAIRGGLTTTKCVLKRPRLVLGYLAAVFLAGAGGAAFKIAAVCCRH
ncbi:MAG: hypothetical protein ABJF01_19865 [bacterium]